MKSIEDHFRDWESEVFGFGYGSGESYVMEALKGIFDAIDGGGKVYMYSYKDLEGAVGKHVAWLLINTLCHADVIEYGASPRYGWLTEQGVALKRFIDERSAEQLAKICTEADDAYVECYPDHCNHDGERCANPFWKTLPKINKD